MAAAHIKNLFTDGLHKIRPNVFEYIIIFIFALIPIWKMGLTGIWSFADAAFPFYPQTYFSASLYAWSHQFWTGLNYMPAFITLGPERVFWAFLSFIGLPLTLINRLTLVGAFALSGFGMYYLMKTIFPFREQSTGRLACIIAALFNMYNPVNIGWLEIGGYNYIIIAGMLPITIAFIYKGFKTSGEGTKWLWYSFLTGLSSMVLLTQQIEMTILVTAFVVVISVSFLLKNIKRPPMALNNSKFLSVTLLISLGLNLWWIIPLVSLYSGTGFVAATYSSNYFLQRLQTISGYPNLLLQTFRMQYYNPNYPAVFVSGNWIDWIASPLNIVVGTLLSCIAYSSLLFRRDSKVALFALSTAFFTVLATGLNPPLGGVYIWLWQNVTVFRAFNNPLKFLNIALLGYSVLLGLAVAEISSWINKKSLDLIFASATKSLKLSFSKIFVVFIVFLILFNSYPLLSGNLSGILEPAQVPDYYYQTRSFMLNQTGDFRVMMVPQLTTGSYVWAPKEPAIYGMIPMSLNVFPVPVIDLIPARVQSHISPVGSPELNIASYVYKSILTQGAYTFDQLYETGFWADDNFTDGWNFVQADLGVISSNFSSLGTKMGAVETVTSQNATGVWYAAQIPPTNTDSFPYLVVQLRGNEKSEYVISVYDSSGSIYNSGVQKAPTSLESLTIQLPPGKTVTRIFLQAKCSEPGNANIYWSFLMFMNTLPHGSGIGKMLNLLNIKYLVLSKDLADPITHEPISVSFIQDFLGNQSDLQFVRSFGDLSIYENLVYEETQVYGSTNYVFLSNDNEVQQMSNYSSLVNRNYINTTDIVALSPDSLPFQYYCDTSANVTNGIMDNLPTNSNVQLDYVRINPSEYTIRVNTTKPFVLTFSETYNSQWVLQTSNSHNIPYHFITNFYANGWYINKTGNYILTLYFVPQTYINQGILGSLFSVTIVLCAIAILTFKKFRVKRTKSTRGRLGRVLS
jgi:hypothetical protein